MEEKDSKRRNQENNPFFKWLEETETGEQSPGGAVREVTESEVDAAVAMLRTFGENEKETENEPERDTVVYECTAKSENEHTLPVYSERSAVDVDCFCINTEESRRETVHEKTDAAEVDEKEAAVVEQQGKKTRRQRLLVILLFVFITAGLMVLATVLSYLYMCRHTITFITADGATTTVVMALENTQIPTGENPENLTFIGWEDSNGNLETRNTIHVWEDTVYTAKYMTALNMQEHIPYLFPDEDGLFHPDENMTRQEAALAIYSLLCGKVKADTAFPDVEKDSPYFTAIAQLRALGVVEGSRFYPQDDITLTELIEMLTAFFPDSGKEFSLSWLPEEDEAYRNFCTAVSLGWIEVDAELDPDGSLTRLEAAHLLNRVTGRNASDSITQEKTGPLPDCGPFNEDYKELAEAAVSHEYTTDNGDERWTESTPIEKRYSGYVMVNYQLRYADINGVFYIGTNEDGFTFGSHGCYTSGNETVDNETTEILEEIWDEKLGEEEQLRAAFDFIVANYAYMKTYSEQTLDDSDTAQALKLFTARAANCVQNAAGFWALARAMGYDAELVRGYNISCMDHGWVVIHTENGNYICDPQLGRVNLGVQDWFMMNRQLYYPWGYHPDPNVIDGALVDNAATRD